MFWKERNKEIIGDSSFLTTQTVENPFDVEQFVVTSSMKHNLTPIKFGKNL